MSKRRRDLSKVSDLEFARALSFGCAYCGRPEAELAGAQRSVR